MSNLIEIAQQMRDLAKSMPISPLCLLGEADKDTLSKYVRRVKVNNVKLKLQLTFMKLGSRTAWFLVIQNKDEMSEQMAEEVLCHLLPGEGTKIPIESKTKPYVAQFVQYEDDE